MGVAKDIYDITKDLMEIADNAGNAEIKMMAADIYIKLAEMKKEYMDLYEENLQLKRKIEENDNLKDIESRITRGKNNVADFTTDKGEAIKICSVCWDRDRKTIQVSVYDDEGYFCSVCKKYLDK